VLEEETMAQVSKLARANIALAIMALPVGAGASTTVLLSDNFSRSPANLAVGTPPTRDTTAASQANAAQNWVSAWGANNNFAGGSVNQAYTTYLGNDGAGVQRNFKVDGAVGISGNWLNNDDPAYPIKSTGSANLVNASLGITGFAWTQINHDFLADPAVQAAERIRVSFDLYRSASGNVSWFFGQSDPTGVANGNAGSPAVIGSNDISVYFRGVQANSFGVRDNGALPAPVPGIGNFDTVSYAAGTTLFPQPLAIQIDIVGTNLVNGQSFLELTVNGTPQDLNGTSVDGVGLAFDWDGGAAAYMGFGSNSTPVEGTVAAPVYRAQGIDNLIVSLVTSIAPFAWNIDADGAWDTGSNWTGGNSPDGASLTATLGDVISSERTVTLASAVSVGTLVVDAGTHGYSLDSSGASRLSAGTIDVRSGTLSLDDSASQNAAVVTTQLQVAAGATVELRDGSLVIDYTGASPLAAVVAQVQAGAITTSRQAVGVIEASAVGASVFGGATVDGTALLLRGTLLGDTDLDATVGFADLLSLAQSYNAAGSWVNGDSDYNGLIEFGDLLSMAQNYGSSLLADGSVLTDAAAAASFSSDWARARSMVPEPAMLAVLAGACVSLLRRR
jgi:hypothetical protein